MSYLDIRMKDIPNTDYIAHFGIPGMKLGIRRYQNEDGTLTEEGKKRYSKYIHDKKYNISSSKLSEDDKKIVEDYLDLSKKKWSSVKLKDIEDYLKKDGNWIDYDDDFLDSFEKYKKKE